MESPGLVILAILAAGALLVLLPVALSSFYEHRRPRKVTCPETGQAATVGLDAGRASRGALFGRVQLFAESCSLWPEKSGCAQKCLATGEAKPESLEPETPGAR